jgi:hypothetical protein
MRKQSTKAVGDDLRKEHDLSLRKGGVRGKYYRRSSLGTNLVLIEPDLTDVFPDSESVDCALRLLADTARAAMSPRRRLRLAESSTSATFRASRRVCVALRCNRSRYPSLRCPVFARGSGAHQ